MKTIPIIVFAALLLAGCAPKTKEDIVKHNVSEYMKARLDNPKTYEPLDFGPVIETTYADKYQYAIDFCNDEIKRHKESLSEDYHSDIAQKLFTEWLNAEIKTRDSIIGLTGTEKDSLIYERTVYHKYRAANKFNAIILNSAILYLDSNLNVIKHTSN